jgi:regulatory protein
VKSIVTLSEAIQKIEKYCAYQDRCHQEVRSKLLSMGIYGDDLEGVIAELIGNNFLNESRFARSFVRGKFRIKKWGRVRIQLELKKRQVSSYCIREGLREIEEGEYHTVLCDLIHQKAAILSEEDMFKKRQKVARFLIGKGYESNLVWNNIENVM